MKAAPARSITMLLLLFTALGASACGSVGPAQRAVNEKPIRFVDARSGAAVETVLLIPQYAKATGVRTGGRNGAEAMAFSRFLAFPVRSQSGEAFQIQQPDSKGLLILDEAFVGQVLEIRGVTVLAPGYAPTFLWNLWDRPPDFQVSLTPLGEASAASRDRSLALLGQPRIRGTELSDAEQLMFNITADDRIEIKMTRDDQDRIRRFMQGNTEAR